MDKDTITINLFNLQSISHALTAAQGNVTAASREIAHSMKSLAHAADADIGPRSTSICLEQVKYAIQLMECVPYDKIMGSLRVTERVLTSDDELEFKEATK